MGARRICLKVISQVQPLSLTLSPTKPSSRIQNHIMGIIDVQKKMIKNKTWCVVPMEASDEGWL